MKRYLMPVLACLFILGFLVRLYRFDNPVADWHSFRQSDTNAVSVVFEREGIDLLHPKYFDISNVQSGKDNPQGYRMVEFPIYNALQAGFASLLPIVSIEQWGRLISIVASLAGAFVVYLLTKKYANIQAALFAAFFYLFLPFSVFYSRAILPDPSMAASILVGIYFFDRFLEDKKPKHIFLVLSIIFTALSFLLKPYALFFAFPMVYLAFEKFGFKIFKQWKLWVFAGVTIIPLILWRKWIGNFPEGVPASEWLLNGNGIRFRPSYFRWIGYERVTRLILGYLGVLFLVFGSLELVKNKKRGFFLSFLSASLLYLVIIATGNVQHDYYQILIIPTIVMFLGLGASFLIKKFKGNLFFQAQVYVIAAALILVSWIQVKDYFNINDWGMVAAAEYADKTLPQDAKVIAAYDGSTTFLNLIKRPGWPVFQSSTEELIAKGAEYMVIANPTPNDFNGFGKMFEPVASSSTYLILRLK